MIKYTGIICLIYSLLALTCGAAGVTVCNDSAEYFASALTLRNYGGVYLGYRCHLASHLNIFADKLSLSNSTELRLVGDAAESGIVITAPSSANASSMGPLLIAIANIRFGQDASLTLKQALPPGSNISIRNNTFDMRSAASTVAIMLLLASDFALTDGASLSIDSNNLNGTVIGKNLILVQLQGTSLLLANTSILDITNNLISDSSSSGVGGGICVVSLRVRELNIDHCSIASIQGNTVVDSTTSIGPLRAVSTFNEIDVKADSYSQIFVKENKLIGIEVTGAFATAVNIETASYLSLSRFSTLEVSGNTVINALVEGNVYAVLCQGFNTALAINITDFSILRIETNYMSNISTPATAYAVSLLMAQDILDLNVINNSAVSLNANVLNKVQKSSAMYACSLQTLALVPFIISQNSSLSVNGNRIVASATDGELFAVILSTVAEMKMTIDNLSICDLGNNSVSQARVGGMASALGIRAANLIINVVSSSAFSQDNNTLEDIVAGSSSYGAFWQPTGRINVSIIGNSSLSLNRHTISNTTAPSVTALHIRSINTEMIFSILSQSSVSISLNTVTQCWVTAWLYSFIGECDEADLLILVQESYFLIDRNAITNSTSATSSAMVVTWTTSGGALLEVSSGAFVSMSKNTLSGTSVRSSATGVSLRTTNDLDLILADRATVSIQGNGLQSMSGSLYAGVCAVIFYSESKSVRATVNSSSVLVMNDNYIKHIASSGEVGAINWRSLGSLTTIVDWQSTISATGNTIESVTAVGDVIVLGWNSVAKEVNFTVAKESTFFLGNTTVTNVTSSLNSVRAISWTSGSDSVITTLVRSKLSIVNSTMSFIGAQSATVVQIDGKSAVLVSSEYSIFDIWGNTINDANTSYSNCIIYWLANEIQVDLTASDVTVAANTVKNVLSSSLSVMRWVASSGVLGVDISDGSNFSVHNNIGYNSTLTDTSAIVFWTAADGGVIIRVKASSVSLNRNVISTVQSTAQASAVRIHGTGIANITLFLMDHSTFSANNNSLADITSASPVVLTIYIAAYAVDMKVTNMSKLDMSGNGLANSSSGRIAYGIYITASFGWLTVMIANQSSAFFNNNWLFGLVVNNIKIAVKCSASNLSIEADYGSTISFSGNQVNSSQTTLESSAKSLFVSVNFESLVALIITIVNGSKFLLIENSINDSTARQSVFGVLIDSSPTLSSITISANSTLFIAATSLSNNKINLTTQHIICGVQFTQISSMIVSDSSVFEVSGTILANNDANVLYAMVINVTGLWSFVRGSRLLVADNHIRNGTIVPSAVWPQGSGIGTAIVALLAGPNLQNSSLALISRNTLSSSRVLEVAGIVRVVLFATISQNSALTIERSLLIAAATESFILDTGNDAVFDVSYSSSIAVINNNASVLALSPNKPIISFNIAVYNSHAESAIKGNCIEIFSQSAACPPAALRLEILSTSGSMSIANNRFIMNGLNPSLLCPLCLLPSIQLMYIDVSENTFISNLTSILSIGFMSVRAKAYIRDNFFHLGTVLTHIIHVNRLSLYAESQFSITGNTGLVGSVGGLNPLDLSILNVTSATVLAHAILKICGNLFVIPPAAEHHNLNTPLVPESLQAVTAYCTLMSTPSLSSQSHSLEHTVSQTIKTISQTIVRFPATIVPVPAVVVTAKQVQDVAGVVVAVTAVASATGGQLGVANALMRLADCSSSSDDDDSLPILVHPLRFSFGDKKALKNAAGAISDTLLVPLIVVAMALGPARLLIMWSRSVPSRAALVQMGWPTLLVLPFANLAEGIGVTTATALSSGEPFGVGMGLVALLVLLTFTGSWVWILVRVVPVARLQLRREEGAAGLGKRRAFLLRMVRPSHRWVPLAPVEGSDLKKISLADVERYGNAVGDKQWYYAELASFVCSLLVGVCESLPPSICRERAVIALIPALLQCGLSLFALIPLERFLQSLLALCLVPMYVVVGVKVFSDSDSTDTLDSAMAVLSAAGNVIGIAIMALGLVVGLWEVLTTHSRSKAFKHTLPVLEMDDIYIRESSTEGSVNNSFAGVRQSFSEDARQPPSQPNTNNNIRTSPDGALHQPQRTVAEVLDFVEQRALEQMLVSDEYL